MAAKILAASLVKTHTHTHTRTYNTSHCRRAKFVEKSFSPVNIFYEITVAELILERTVTLLGRVA